MTSPSRLVAGGLGISAAAMLGLQRLAGNQATVAAAQASTGQRSSDGNHSQEIWKALREAAVAPRIQRNIGVEIEIVDSGKDNGMAFALHKNCQWDKRDIVHADQTWDLTLDDTPGDAEYNLNGGLYTPPNEQESEKLRTTTVDEGFREKDVNELRGRFTGPFRMFDLEFIVHGGGGKRGFADDDYAGLRDALIGIEAFCDRKLEDRIIFGNGGKVKGLPLWLYPPQGVPTGPANVQLTAGASLTGLQMLLERNKNMNGATNEENAMVALAISDQARMALAESYISPDMVARALGSKSVVARDALSPLSSMLTVIGTFLRNREKAAAGGNMKEAAPVLWKTPLNLFFKSRDLRPYASAIEAEWPGLVKQLFAADYSGQLIKYPPNDHQKWFGVMDWLIRIPTEDLLTKADADYNKSFGGIGSLEGGAKPTSAGDSAGSAGQPIFEFRSMLGILPSFRVFLEEIVRMLAFVNA